MNLILHVGLHKTGTSTLQSFLAENRKLLLSEGILYPQSGLAGSQHALFAASMIDNHPFVDTSECPSLEENLISLAKEIATHKPTLTIIGSEVFCEIEKDANLASLVSRLAAPFSFTRILITTREPSRRALSSIKHRIREGFREVLIDPISCIGEEFAWQERNIKRFSNLGYHTHFKRMEDRGTNSLITYYLDDLVCDAFPGFKEHSNAYEHRSNSDYWHPLMYVIALVHARSLLQGNADRETTKALLHLCATRLCLDQNTRTKTICNDLLESYLRSLGRGQVDLSSRKHALIDAATNTFTKALVAPLLGVNIRLLTSECAQYSDKKDLPNVADRKLGALHHALCLDLLKSRRERLNATKLEEVRQRIEKLYMIGVQ